MYKTVYLISLISDLTHPKTGSSSLMLSSRSIFLERNKYEPCGYNGTIKLKTIFYDSLKFRIFYGLFFGT